MSEYAHISVINFDELSEHTQNGVVVPLHAGPGLEVVDCGDHRALTRLAAWQRRVEYGREVVPGRYYGGAAGLAATALISMAAQTGDKFIGDFVNEYGPEGFVDFATDLAKRTAELENEHSTILTYHSADSNEASDVWLAPNHGHDHVGLGCKFMLLMGRVISHASEQASIDGAHYAASLAGQELPLTEAAEGARILSRYIQPDFSIQRTDLYRSAAKEPQHTNISILEDCEKDISQLAAVIDLAGYRSLAGRDRYHHTPGIAADILPQALPEWNHDDKLLRAGGLLIGESTNQNLSGLKTPSALRREIIPEEYAAAA